MRRRPMAGPGPSRFGATGPGFGSPAASPTDRVVPPKKGPRVLERLGDADKELVGLENPCHVAIPDEADLIAGRAVRFVRGTFGLMGPSSFYPQDRERHERSGYASPG